MQTRAGSPARFYGWTLIGIGFLVYGLGIAPGYYSWGFFAPEMIADLGLSREQVGAIFGTFTLTFALVGPFAAWCIRRLGVRATTTLGALVAAAGFALVGRAGSLAELYLTYALLGGIGVGLSTGFPTQTLAVNWFRRYRARAVAIVLLGAAVFGAFVNPLDDQVMQRWGWRPAWPMIGGISVLVALIAVIFVRDHPEDLGQRPDGDPPEEPREEGHVAPSAEALAALAPRWTAAQAIRTPHFFIATFAIMANVVPWRVLSAHGRLHFEDLGFTPAAAAAILGMRVGISAFGRLSGSLGDFLAPTRVLALALVVNGLGLAGLLFATSLPLAYLCVILHGIGYGAGYTCEPVVFADFFGRHAFVGTTGLRVAIIGIASWIAPTLAGAAADRSGTYSASLAVLALVCFVAAATILFFPRPAARAPTA